MSGLLEQSLDCVRGKKVKPGKANRVPTTRNFQFLRAWQTQEKKRLDNLRIVGDSNKIKNHEAEVVKRLEKLLDEHDKLLKYCRIVVRCHEKHNFKENVNAIRAYLVEELQIEP